MTRHLIRRSSQHSKLRRMKSEQHPSTFLQNLETGISTAGISPNHSIVCAVSGGIDSTALLLGLHSLQHRFKSLIAAHYNHRARGEESDADEYFVRALCEDNRIPLTIGRSEKPMPNLDENSARQHRYSFLALTAEQQNIEVVATAHTIDDQAETILLRITRGAGIRGASGMRITRSAKTPSGDTVIIFRPMLQTSRREAERFLQSLNIEARHDTSNDDWARYARNRIRHRITPELNALNPQAVHAIVRFGEILRSNTDLVEQLADDTLRRASTGYPNTLLRKIVASAHPVIAAEALSAMYRNLASGDTQLDQRHIDKLLELISTGKSATYHLPDSITFWTNHEHVGLTGDCSTDEDTVPYPRPIQHPVPLPLPGKACLGNGYTITSTISALPDNYHHANDGEAWLQLPQSRTKHLLIRNRQPSDRFNPLGMEQDVELSKFLINSKVAASWRDRIPVVVSPDDGRIVWLPGIRIAEWAKVSLAHRTAIHLQFRRESDA